MFISSAPFFHKYHFHNPKITFFWYSLELFSVFSEVGMDGGEREKKAPVEVWNVIFLFILGNANTALRSWQRKKMTDF